MVLEDLKEKVLDGNLSELLLHSNDEDFPTEVAKLFEELPDDVCLTAFNALPEAAQIKTFSFLDHVLQRKVVDHLPRIKAAIVLNNLESNDRLAFFDSLNAWDVSEFISFLDEKNKRATLDLLGYPEQSVARLINTAFTAVRKEMTITEAMRHLRHHYTDSEASNMIYVVDSDGHLVDDIPIRRLVLNEPTQTIEDIMDGSYVKLNIQDKIEDAITKFKEYDRVALPVTNQHNVLMGVVTVDDVIDEAEEQDTKDMQQFGGMESLDMPYVRTPFFTLIRKRAGWLIILFLSEMLTATAMGHFADVIQKVTLLALFIPLVMSSGGNSGSQAATLVIRAMALKELSPRDWWYIMRREASSGLTLGIILGTIGFIRIAIWQTFGWWNYGAHWPLVGITIFFGLIGIVMWGTLSGAMIPVILKSLKLDPAASSAPFVATLVDVTGLIIYFSVAMIVLKGTYL
ncbi:MAG TPA: magnesium transporter [Flavipsychrobacter sp.]|nr:magnesium transporter [Flavipsychrobacter sp.]